MPLPRGGRLPGIAGRGGEGEHVPRWSKGQMRGREQARMQRQAEREDERQRRVLAMRCPPPSMSAEAVAALGFGEKQSLLEKALPNRAPPPPGWTADDVGGVPWHKKARFGAEGAAEALKAAEEAMCRVMGEKDQKAAVKVKEQEMYRGKIVTAAIGQRVMVEGVKRGEAVVVRGLYQMNGRIMEDDTKRVLNPPDFAGLALVGEAARRFFIAIKLESDPETSLQALADAHGTTHGREKRGEHAGGPALHVLRRRRVDRGQRDLAVRRPQLREQLPPALLQPAGGGGAGGRVALPVVRRARQRDRPRGRRGRAAAEGHRGRRRADHGRANDGSGDQDIELMMEVVECVDSSLPLIGRANAAKLVFAPDHQSLVLRRRNELPSGAVVRRVLGALVVKPHLARGFLEIAYCVVRKEEQRNGIGSRLISACSRSTR